MKNGKSLLCTIGLSKSIVVVFIIGYTSVGPEAQAQSPPFDLTFNGTGYAWADLVWEDHVEDIVVTSEGIIYAAGYTTNSMFTQAYVASFLQDGSLNQAFNLEGKKIFHFGNGTFSKAHGLCLQADGKILITGEHSSSDASESIRKIGMARLNADGTFDEEFYQTGRRTYSPVTNQAGDSWSEKIKMGPDGMIYVLGVDGGTTNNQAVIAKFFSDGTNATSFGSGGYQILYTTISFTDQIRGSLELVIQPDGKLVPLFWHQCAELDCFWSGYNLKRINPDGSPDGSFGSANPPYGISLTGETNEWNMGVGGLTMQTDGKFIVAGRTKGLNGRSLGLVARLTSDGQLDDSFGTGGKVIVPGGWDDLEFSDVEVKPDGRIVCIGTTSNAQIGDYVAVHHLLSNGALDSSFTSLGVYGSSAFQLPPWSGTVGIASALQQDQKLLVCGTAVGPSGGDDSYVARILLGPNGVGLNETVDLVPMFAVHPNPIMNESLVQFDLEAPTTITMELRDIQGRLVKTMFQNRSFRSGKHSFPVDLDESLAAGSYLLSAVTPNGKTSIQVTK